MLANPHTYTARNVSIGHRCPHKVTLETGLIFDPEFDLDLDLDFRGVKYLIVQLYRTNTFI